MREILLAQTLLEQVYNNGFGVSQDFTIAVKWWVLASEE